MAKFKITWADAGMGTIAVLAGSLVIYLGDMMLGVNLEMFYGVATYSPIWVVDLFLVTFVGGIVVSLIFGLGGKILAHLSPLPVRIASYIEINNLPEPPEIGTLLPISYWLLVLVIAMEFAAIGGVVGEILVKKTYGRTDKRLFHKKYQKKTQESAQGTASSNKDTQS